MDLPPLTVIPLGDVRACFSPHIPYFKCAPLVTLANYLACDSDADSIDLYGLNVYRWCGAGDISNYAGLITDYQNYPIPAYFSEFGCVTSPPRLWTEVGALFGSQMTPEWSGGMAFSVSFITYLRI